MSKTVLIVDDSATIRRFVVSALDGFEVVEAKNGLDGVETMESRQDIQLALVDINMPTMGGIEMLKRVRGNAVNDRVNVVMLTTETQPNLAKKARELGANGWVSKPVNALQLLAIAKKFTGE